MQITRKNWKSDVVSGADGTVNVTPEDADDIWALYNLIGPGDIVESATLRKVLHESSSGDVVDSSKVKMVLAVSVEKVDVDLASASLRINGRNVRENQHVKLGSYHTLEIEPDRWLKITKTSWDALAVELLEQALRSVGRAEIGALVMGEGGLAFVCSITPTGTKVLQRIEVAMPKKKLGPTTKAEKSLDKFLLQCLDGVMTHIRFDALKAIVLASTETSLREELYAKLLERAQHDGNRSVLDNKAKFMRVGVAAAQPSALEALLKEPRIAAILANTKAAMEAKVLDAFYKMHNNEPERTTFGPKHVMVATEECAIKALLLSDSLFRSTNVQQRKLFAHLVGTVKENGGEVTIFSAGSAPEAELQKLTGIAAILNFPLDLEAIQE